MKRISTHVLDLMRGKPARELAVRLHKRTASGGWQLLASAETDADGRCAQLLQTDELPAGQYKLDFDTGAYFNAQRIDGLYPVVEVVFSVREGESQCHIPLLLSANGYTTYRGS